ncbi:MAG TPA: hypothetical protein VNO30_16555 [Kofleriaceae bacterium]|nr:hypothetical protein [Kofleriaceae bacterium]
MLGKLEGESRRKFLIQVAQEFAKAHASRRAQGLARVASDTERLRAALDAFVRIEEGEAIQRELEEAAGRGNLWVPSWIKISDREKRYASSAVALPKFGEALIGTIYEAAARDLDAAEEQLVLGVTTLSVHGSDADEARRGYVNFRQAMRMALATTFVRSVAYDEVWGPVANPPPGRKLHFPRGIYGTAGYRLSQIIPTLADDLVRSYEPLRSELNAEANDWIRSYVSVGGRGGVTAYNVEEQLTALSREVRIWQDQHRDAASSQRGESFPFQFPRIPFHVIAGGSATSPGGTTPVEPRDDPPPAEDESSEHETGATTGEEKESEGPDHMHARPEAVERIQLVIRLWNQYRGLLQLPGFEHEITAGSLLYGGAHPPHQTHRNGAMFDTVLRGIGVAVCERHLVLETSDDELEVEESAPPILPPIKGQIEQLQRELYWLQEPDSESSGFSMWSSDTKPLEESCLEYHFPPSLVARPHQHEAIMYQELGVRYTQCVLLSFPSQVLFASWKMLRDAKLGLMDAVAKQSESTRVEEARKALAWIKKELGSRPPQVKPVRLKDDNYAEGSHENLFPRADHANHWHVSYDAAELEKENAARDHALEWVRNHGAELIFRSLLPSTNDE